MNDCTSLTDPLLHNTDLGNARRLVRRYDFRIRYCAPLGGWLLYTEGRWRRDESLKIEALAKDVVQELHAEAAQANSEAERSHLRKHALGTERADRLSAIVRVAASEPGIAVSADLFDANPWVLNARNGTVDLRTGALLPHRPEDLLSHQANASYVPQAPCPWWQWFLHRTFGGDAEMIAYIQRLVGYALTGDMSEQEFYLLVGTGANGKTVFIEIIMFVLGTYARTMDPNLLVRTRNEQHPTALADLRGARFATGNELSADSWVNEALLKRLVGGDRVTARRMYQDFFEFSPTAKLLLAVNTKPSIAGQDHGIWRRIRVLPFEVTIPENERDKHLLDKLKTEADGILWWAVLGCLDWQHGGLRTLGKVIEASNEYRSEMDAVGHFLEDNCERDANATISFAMLFDSYENWCEQVSEEPLSKRAFATRLDELGFPKDRGAGNSAARKGLRRKVLTF